MTVTWPPVPKPVVRETDIVAGAGRPRLVCSLPVHFLPEIRRELSDLFQVSFCYNVPREAVTPLLPDAEALLVNGAAPYRLDRDLLSLAPNLRLIANPSTGSDHIDLDYCAERGIAVRGLKGETEVIDDIHASAEFSFTLMMAMLRNLPRAYDLARAGYWREVEDELRGVELHGRTVGLIGYGRIGRKMSRYANAFGARVIAYDPFVTVADAWATQLRSLDELLAAADIVCVHVHLDADTRGLFDAARFSRMKRGSYFLNTSRGAVVDERALIDALESGHLRAAAVDVVQGEVTGRIANNPLLEYARTHSRLTVTPHIGGLSVDSQRKSARWALQHLKAFFGLG